MACGWAEWDETYWTVCWAWIVPYPCRKTRHVRRWCCDFEWIKETRWFVFCTLEGCAGGERYRWTAFCLFLIGTAWFYNVRKCFSSELRPVGEC
jgi:hypothetical protein